MKTLLRIALTASTVFFVACGGGGKDDSPPQNYPLMAPAGQQTMNDAIAQLQQIKNGACDGYANVLTTLGAAQVTQVGTAAVLPSLMTYQVNACDMKLKNVIYNLAHILMKDGTLWINQPGSMQYCVRQVAQVLNRIGQVAAPQLQQVGTTPVQVLAQSGSAIGMFLSQGLLPRIGGGTSLMAMASPYIPR